MRTTIVALLLCAAYPLDAAEASPQGDLPMRTIAALTALLLPT